MNYRGILLATIIGISTPAITGIAFSNLVLANPSFKYLNSKFYYSKWSVNSKLQDKAYTHGTKKLQLAKRLKEIEISKKPESQQKQVNKSRKNLHRYRIAYRPNDRNLIRLQIFNSEGQIILNFALPSNNS
jgi:hypothetical protein